MSECLPFARSPRQCDLCGAPLVGRQQRWCSLECSDTYWPHHSWKVARETALGRARIGIKRYRCAICGCGTRSPEVNHRTPALGAHSQTSCAHHQDNLEVLCHDCHLGVTVAQRAAGLLRRTA
jgi:hypothetical protein